MSEKITTAESIPINIRNALELMDSTEDPHLLEDMVYETAHQYLDKASAEQCDHCALCSACLAIGMAMIHQAAVERSKQDDHPASSHS